jgi:hypothetical protein
MTEGFDVQDGPEIRDDTIIDRPRPDPKDRGPLRIYDPRKRDGPLKPGQQPRPEPVMYCSGWVFE